MAAERLDMRCVREILRLHFEQKHSPRKIAQSQGCGRTTIRDYLEKANKNGLTNWALIEPLSQVELEVRLGLASPHRVPGPRAQQPMPDWPTVHRELCNHKNVTLMLLWHEYLADNPGGYQYTQFCEYYRRWAKKLSVVLRQSHKAGEKAFVDYCDGIALIDPLTGQSIRTQLFVGCLGASSYTFAEVSLSQDLPSWCGSHARMYAFFGGVPEITVPDNLKSGVTKPCFVEPVINEMLGATKFLPVSRLS